MAQEAKLLDDSLTDAEKLRLAMLLGYMKHGLKKIPNGFAITPIPMQKLGDEYKSSKNQTNYKPKRLSMTKFFLQPEEAQFFSMSPRDPHNQVQLTMKPKALVPNPSREMRALLPNVDWDPLPSLETGMTDSSDEEEDDGGTLNSSTSGTDTSVSHSLFNPEPRQVGSFLLKHSFLAMQWIWLMSTQCIWLLQAHPLHGQMVMIGPTTHE